MSFIAFFIAINCCMRENLLTVSFIGNAPTNKAVGFAMIAILQFKKNKCVGRWNKADFLGLMNQWFDDIK